VYPSSKKVLCGAYLLVVWFDILRAIAELNRASHFIAAYSEYFEICVVSIVIILWAMAEHKLIWFTFQTTVTTNSLRPPLILKQN